MIAIPVVVLLLSMYVRNGGGELTLSEVFILYLYCLLK